MTPEERAAFAQEVVCMLGSQQNTTLTPEEHEWVKLAIKREAQSIALRQAVIEKSLTSLIWAVIVGAGYVLLDFAKNHGIK